MTVTYTTEDFVRRAVGSLLRGKYSGRFVCSSCLVRLTLERLQTGWRRSEIEAGMERMFRAPGRSTTSRRASAPAAGNRSRALAGSRR